MPFVEHIRGAFPDINIKIEDAFGARDKVVVRWSATMTHKGDHLGIPASGKPVRITGMTMVRIRNGQIVEGWDNWDQLAMMQQIGAYGQPEAVLPTESAGHRRETSSITRLSASRNSFRMRRDNFDKPCYGKEGSSAIRGWV